MVVSGSLGGDIINISSHRTEVDQGGAIHAKAELAMTGGDVESRGYIEQRR